MEEPWRQPTFNGRRNVIGYELLYRSGLTNSYSGTGETAASLAGVHGPPLDMALTHLSRSADVIYA